MSQTGATATRQRRVPRMLERYRKEIARELAKQFKHKNLMAAAHLEKIVLNIGCGDAAHDAKVLEAAQRDLALIAGQQPAVLDMEKLPHRDDRRHPLWSVDLSQTAGRALERIDEHTRIEQELVEAPERVPEVQRLGHASDAHGICGFDRR